MCPKLHIAPVRRSGHQQKKLPNLHPECFCLGFHVFWLWLVYVSSTLEIGKVVKRDPLGFLGCRCLWGRRKDLHPWYEGSLELISAGESLGFCGVFPGILQDSPETVVVRVGMYSLGYNDWISNKKGGIKPLINHWMRCSVFFLKLQLRFKWEELAFLSDRWFEWVTFRFLNIVGGVGGCSFERVTYIHLKLTACPWKLMVGKWFSFGE